MARYDTTQFMADVIRDAKVPAGSSYRTASTLLGIASDEMEELVVPELIKVTGGLLMAYEDRAMVAGKTRYRFPERAIRPERLQLVNADGKLLGKLHLASGDMVDEVLAGRCPSGDALGYWVHENNHAVIVLQRSDPSASGRLLRTYFRQQPSRLAEVGGAEGGRIIDAESEEIYVLRFSSQANATAFYASAYTSGGLVDFIIRKPPFETLLEDQGLTAATNAYLGVLTDVRVTLSVIPTGDELPEVGDHVYLAGYTPLPQLPVAFHGVLKAYTVARILRETGHEAAAQAALDEAGRKLTTALTTITPRSDEAETTVNDVWGV